MEMVISVGSNNINQGYTNKNTRFGGSTTSLVREFTVSSENPFPKKYQHYWDGLPQYAPALKKIYLNAEGLLSFKPIIPFLKLAQELPKSIKTIFEPFSGSGGSAIGFGLANKKVKAFDYNDEMVFIARKNAKLYGLKRNSCAKADARNFFTNSRKKGDCVHLDPPWGGLERKRGEPFTFDNFGEFGESYFRTALSSFKHVIVSVPLEIDLNSLTKFGRSFKLAKGQVDNKNRFYILHFYPEGYSLKRQNNISHLSKGEDLNEYKDIGKDFTFSPRENLVRLHI